MALISDFPLLGSIMYFVLDILIRQYFFFSATPCSHCCCCWMRQLNADLHRRLKLKKKSWFLVSKECLIKWVIMWQRAYFNVWKNFWRSVSFYLWIRCSDFTNNTSWTCLISIEVWYLRCAVYQGNKLFICEKKKHYNLMEMVLDWNKDCANK